MIRPTAGVIEKFYKRSVELQSLFDINPIEKIRIFPYKPKLAHIEYVAHEIAHGLTMGFSRLPTNLPSCIAETILRYSAVTRDHLEIDTAFVTFEALFRLRLTQEDARADFARRCAESLDDKRHMDRTYFVMDELEVRNGDEALASRVSELVQIFRAPLPLVRNVYLMPDDVPESL